MPRRPPGLAVALAAAWAALSGGGAAVSHAQDDALAPDDRVLALLAEDLEAKMRRSPTWASMRGDRRFDDRLGDPSPAAEEAWVEAARRRLAALDELPAEGLSPANRINAALLRRELEERIAGHRFRGWLTPVSQLSGPQQWLPQLPERLSFTRRAHREAYLERLRAVPAYVRQTIANLRAGVAAGLTPPRVVLGSAPAQALAQGDPALAEAPEEHAMFAPFAELPGDDPLAASARAAIAEAVVPAFRELGEFLRDDYLPACRESTAAVDRPDGAAYYAWRLRVMSTLDLGPEEIHTIGREEVARIRAEMMETIARSDFPRRDALEGDALFAAFVDHLRTAPRFYHDTPGELLRGYRDVAKRVDAELPALFRTLPRNTYGVRPLPDYLAPSAPTAYYYSGSLENGVPGYFMANTHRLDQRPTYEMVPLTLHEAVPGHHLQIALAQELEGLPEWRTTLHFTAFVEGWALYAERLGLEMGEGPRGLYADPYDDFGRLSYEMWRAMRLVVDTGLHDQRWMEPGRGDRLHAREQRPDPGERRARGRPLHRLAGPGGRLQARRAEDPRAAPAGRGGPRRGALLGPRLPRRRPRPGGPAPAAPRGAGRALDRPGRGRRRPR